MLLYWIWFAQLKGIPLWLKLVLLQHFSDPEEIFFAREDAFSQVEELHKEHLEALKERSVEEARKILEQCERKGIRVITLADSTYPTLLRHIQDPPVVLYYQGVLPDWDHQPCVGVVGTRKATVYGLQSAYQMGKQIAQCGGLVVSGVATGIDAKSMEGALDEGKPTVGVLGCGVDVIYPRNHRKLYARTRENGCLLSEYPPGDAPLGWHFPQRNRIISGISNAVLVVEAPQRSGALKTAEHARRQGRDVFAVPANMGNDNFVGSNTLLEEGATAALSGWRIVREYAALYPDGVCEPGKLPVVNRDAEPQKVAQKPVVPEKLAKKDIDNPENTTYSVLDNEQSALSSQEQEVLSLIGRVPLHPDEVAARTDLPAAKVQAILTKLTIKGFLVGHGGGRVSLK